MLRRRLPLGLMVAVIIAGGAQLQAQTITTGAIEGNVKDGSGAPVAGATVRLASGQITRTVTTNVEGHYRMPLLNVGSWQVRVTRVGYTTQDQTIQVGVNATSTMNFKLAKEATAIVEVLASASVIDTTSTTTGSNYSLDAIAPIPMGRDITDIAFLTPGVSSSGFGKGNGLDIAISGASGAENSYTIDGLTTNDMRYGGAGVNLVSDFVEQVDVQTGGFKPEYSALGGVFNVVTKSGSNQFTGSAWVTATPSSMSPSPKRNDWVQEDKAASHYDAGFWVGGALMPDRIFYSVGLDYTRLENPAQLNASNLNIPSSTTATNQICMKINGYLNTDNQLTFSYFGTPSSTEQGATNTPNSIGDGRGTADQGGTFKHRSTNWNLIYDGVISPTMNISAKYGSSIIDVSNSPLNSNPLVNDTLWDSYQAGGALDVGAIYSSGGSNLIANENNKTTQYSVDFNWILGDHALKLGTSHLESKYGLVEFYPGGARFTVDMQGGNPRLRERVITNNASVKAQFDAIYLQDTWQATQGLNIFYGIRMESQNQTSAEGVDFLKFGFGKYIQPRLGFTWDVLGNGRSKVSGSYGRYYEKIPQRMAIREFGGETFYENRYGGSSATSTFTYDPTNPNHYGTFTGTPKGVDYASGFNNPPVEDNIKLPQRDEFQLGYTQQISDHLTVGIQGRYRKLTHPIEDSVITDLAGNSVDPNEMAIIWNPKPGPISFNASDGSGKITVDQTYFPEAYNTYKALDLTLEWKTSTSMLHVGYTWSRLEGNYEGVVSSSNGQADGNITASYDYYPYVGTGPLPLDHTHSLKIYGAHTFTVAGNPLQAGFNFLWESGSPISLWDDGSTTNGYVPGYDTSNDNGDGTVANPAGSTNATHRFLDIGYYGDSIPSNGKLGQYGRTPSHARLDLSFNYEIPLTKKVKLAPMISVFNVFNSRPIASVNEQATDSGGTAFPAGKWASATSWFAGRSVLFGAKLHF
jgi:Carboxypeptidase regulatory-like domain/TonB-dependent Receptor Plug Domain